MLCFGLAEDGFSADNLRVWERDHAPGMLCHRECYVTENARLWRILWGVGMSSCRADI